MSTSQTQEMDLIEVLWKQDVDLGYNPIIPTLNPTAQQQKEAAAEDEIEKLKALLELKTDKVLYLFFWHLIFTSPRLSQRKTSTET